ncbi:hypothetical protein [Acetobacterium woodii]|uniref:Uncharacterized protein n=1 Tax=Acetobacterium woodii (strain ATCC 29683 / DSM 1030 / JCM 2381 / KCTC 1655 / WB1) TaxID=931626 RepID=H6LIM1_ACEWD|nr:hypothetical protein [Acetobacterium woodii]AFA48595.1 hypothetical protein Awo_c18150 [Acetobacterium woodii DSM 1030]
MKSRKIKACLVLLMILILGLSPPGIAAREKNKTDLDLPKQENPDNLKLVAWKGTIANAETGETIEINSKDDKQLVTQKGESQLYYFNNNFRGEKYYQELTVNIPETVDKRGSGIEISSPMLDENNVISVVLGMGYAMGYSGNYQVIRIDGVYVNWEITDPTVKLTDVQLGYRIMNGIGVENGAVNELTLWDLETDANTYETERIGPSPWIFQVKDFVHAKTIFAGNLTDAKGKSRSIVMEFNYSY